MKCLIYSRPIFSDRKIIYFISIFLFLFIITALPIFAQTQVDPLKQLQDVANEAGLQTEKDVPALAGGLVKVVLQMLGLLLVILFIIGGFMWMTSGGNEEKVKKAKGILTSAVIGLVIVILAYTIASFVMEKLTDVTTSE